MDEVGELDRVLDKEHGCVVAYHVVVAILSVMLEGEAAGVTVAVVGSTFASHGGEAEEGWGFFADLVEELGLAETKKVTRQYKQKVIFLMPETYWVMS